MDRHGRSESEADVLRACFEIAFEGALGVDEPYFLVFGRRYRANTMQARELRGPWQVYAVVVGGEGRVKYKVGDGHLIHEYATFCRVDRDEEGVFRFRELYPLDRAFLRLQKWVCDRAILLDEGARCRVTLDQVTEMI